MIGGAGWGDSHECRPVWLSRSETPPAGERRGIAEGQHKKDIDAAKQQEKPKL